MTEWMKLEDGEGGPTGAGGQVWVAYRNPNHPYGWSLRIQWTPLQQELGVIPEYWCPVEYPSKLPEA